MTTSASAVLDQLVSVIDGITNCDATKYGYDILETTTSLYAFHVEPSEGDNERGGFGNLPYHQNMDFMAHGFIRLESDPKAYHTARVTLIDAMNTTFDNDQTLSGTCEGAYVARWSFPDVELDVHGVIWQPVDFTIRCLILN